MYDSIRFTTLLSTYIAIGGVDAAKVCSSDRLRPDTAVSGRGLAQQAPRLRITGKDAQPLELTPADFKNLPRLAVEAKEPHSGTVQHYEGVRLSDLLAKAGVPSGEKLRGAALARYVVAEANDAYAVVFSIAELDPAMNDNRIIVADTLDSKPLGEHDGPWKIVVPGEKRPARWVRMLKELRVESAVNPSGSSPR